MATSSSQNPKVMVGGKHVSIEELDNLRDAVCLLKWQSKDKSKQWSGYGFYANVKTKKHGKTLDISCIITLCDDIFLEMEEHGGDMVAVFHHESGGKEAFELTLVPFKLLAHEKRQRLDYALIFIDESKMNVKGVKPILVDSSQLPVVQRRDKVYMIHHTGKMRRHYSEDKTGGVIGPDLLYLANTLEGPPGSPVFVFKDSKFLLVAMHRNSRAGVLVLHILDDLHIPSVLSKLPEPSQNLFVKALSWGLSWLVSGGPAPFWPEQDMPPEQDLQESMAEVPQESMAKYEPWWNRFVRGLPSPFRRVPSARTPRSIQSQSADFDFGSSLYEEGARLDPKIAETSSSTSDDEDTVKHQGESEWKSSRYVPCGSSSYGEGARLHPKIAETSSSTSDDEDTVKHQGESEWKPSRCPRLDSKIPEISRSSSDDEGTKFKGKGEWKPSQSYKITRTITVDGCAIETDDITLNAGQGCLAENTDIVMERVDHQFDVLKSLLDLRLVDAAPRVIKFSPDGLKFLKPVDLTIKFEKTVTGSERFILHGFYNPIYQRIIWELVTNGVEENDVEGVIHVKINSFSFYMFFLSTYRFLAQILNYINRSPICLARSFFRRSPLKDTIDIAVVLVSEVFDENKENNIKHLIAEGFVKGEKGVLKRVNNDHLEMCLHFPGIETRPYPFQIDQYLVDSVGFVIDHFKKIAVMAPANGEVKIRETVRRDENESLWILNVYEINEAVQAEVAQELSTSRDTVAEEAASSDLLPAVVNPMTRLTNTEMASMSCEIGVHWSGLAALVNIPYSLQEQIRMNVVEFLSLPSKAAQVLKLLNNSECFDRNTLVKCFEELKRHDLKNMMLPMNDEDEPEDMATPRSQPESFEVQNDTPLSSRELYRLSLHVAVNWDTLAPFLGITEAEKDNVRYNLLYTSIQCKAEKMLAMFNLMENFSRQRLAECFKEIRLSNLIEPVMTGKWRKL